MSQKDHLVNPRYFHCYLYEFDSASRDRIIIKISIFPDFPQNDFSVKFNKEKSGIVLGIKNELPFISGICYHKYKNVKWSFSTEIITLTIFKEDPSIQWPILIKYPLPKHNIDPLSALLLSQCLMSGHQSDAKKFLMFSVNRRFPPAIVTYVSSIFGLGLPISEYLPLLYSCVNDYKYSPAGLLIGNMCLSNSVPIDVCLPLLKICAYELNDINAKFLLTTFLSPKRDPHGPFEDAIENISLLEEIKDCFPLAKSELAQFLHEGIYCYKDETRAKQLLIESHKEDTSLPSVFSNNEPNTTFHREDEHLISPQETADSPRIGTFGMIAVAVGLIVSVGVLVKLICSRSRQKCR